MEQPKLYIRYLTMALGQSDSLTQPYHVRMGFNKPRFEHRVEEVEYCIYIFTLREISPCATELKLLFDPFHLHKYKYSLRLYYS